MTSVMQAFRDEMGKIAVIQDGYGDDPSDISGSEAHIAKMKKKLNAPENVPASSIENFQSEINAIQSRNYGD